MKRIILGLSILAVSGAIIVACKPKANVPPEPDTETQSAVYASYANFLVTDVDMICSFMGENLLKVNNYMEYPGSAPVGGNTGTMTCIRDTTSVNPDNGKVRKRLAMIWNKTRCLDGRLRDGTVILDYGEDVEYPNAKYAREYKFKGRVLFSNYKVDGWLIDVYDPKYPCYIYNQVPNSNYDPTTTNLTWTIEGRFKMTHPTDPANKSMDWEGKLTKILTNTSDAAVFKPTKNTAITWSLAVNHYYGSASGTVPQIDADGNVTASVPYKYTVDQSRPLVRDFQCYPDKVSGIAFTNTVGVMITRKEEFHPFKSGVASFTVGSAYPRQIYYGNEGEPTLDPQCDNVGEVLIKGISYRVDFFK